MAEEKPNEPIKLEYGNVQLIQLKLLEKLVMQTQEIIELLKKMK